MPNPRSFQNVNEQQDKMSDNNLVNPMVFFNSWLYDPYCITKTTTENIDKELL